MKMINLFHQKTIVNDPFFSIYTKEHFNFTYIEEKVGLERNKEI